MIFNIVQYKVSQKKRWIGVSDKFCGFNKRCLILCSYTYNNIIYHIYTWAENTSSFWENLYPPCIVYICIVCTFVYKGGSEYYITTQEGSQSKRQVCLPHLTQSLMVTGIVSSLSLSGLYDRHRSLIS